MALDDKYPTLLEAIVLVCPIIGLSEDSITFDPAATVQQQQVANAILAFWNANNRTLPPASIASLLTELREAAKQYHLALQAENRALRATVKILVDELNILRQWMTDMKAATAASSSYATLKSGIGTLPATPQRTYAQARTAIETLIDGES